MTHLQAAILAAAPRYTNYYLRGDDRRQRPQLITDTPSARKRALGEGAVQFDTLSVLRRDEIGAPAPTYFGDFYGRISRREGIPPEEFLRRVAIEVSGVMASRFQLFDHSAIWFTYLRFDATTVGVTIPSAAFGMEGGSPFLHMLYEMFAQGFLNSFPGLRKWCDVTYTGLADATNHPLPLQEVAVPLSLTEMAEESLDGVRKLAVRPRNLPARHCNGRIGGDVYRLILSEAKTRWLTTSKSQRTNVAANWSLPSALLNAKGVPYDPSISMAGIKCALRLSEWMRRHSLAEFRQRDALRAVDGSFTLGGGVAEALMILQNHEIIRSCARLTTARHGRPSGPWFLVNPHHRMNSNEN